VFVFKKDQQVFDFNGIRFGGNPGENPTVLVGGLFFKGQEIVIDTKSGTFDKALAKDWIDTAVSMSERTGHPLVLQVYGRMPESMEQHIPWVLENFDGPIMFESINARARIRSVEICEEQGVCKRAIYNGVNISLSDKEKEVLSHSPLDMTVVLGWSPRTTSLPERMGVIESLIKTSTNLGFTKTLIDPATMPVGAGYGLDYRTVIAIKSELGLPTCLAPDNAPSAWKFLKQPEFNDESLYMSSAVAAATAAQLFATDCIMFGSLARSREVFTAVSLIANAISAGVAESYRALGIKRTLFSPPTFE
jgi:tetrahydromethanopterin S-methyltransferase subunit H